MSAHWLSGRAFIRGKCLLGFIRSSLQLEHDQGAQDHGQVGTAHPHLAAEDQGWQGPGHIPGEQQARTYLKKVPPLLGMLYHYWDQ